MVEFIRTEHVPHRQFYLKNIILQHPAWLSYTNIKSFEFYPRLPICVGFWHGTTTGVAQNANLLQNSGLISYLLPVADNPKGLTLTQTQLTGTKSGKVIGPILRMAITVHTRPLGENFEDEYHSLQLRIKHEDSSSLSKDISLSTNSILSLPSHKAEQLKAVSVTDKTSSNLPLQRFEHNTASPTGSTTQEDRPPPFYLPASALLLSTHVLSASKSSNRFPERPAILLQLVILDPILQESDV